MVCTCKLCLLSSFHKCEYDLLDDWVLIKNVVAIHKKTKLTIKQEEVEADQLTMDFPNESYHYKNISTVASDLSFEIKNTSSFNQESLSSDDDFHKRSLSKGQHRSC